MINRLMKTSYRAVRGIWRRMRDSLLRYESIYRIYLRVCLGARLTPDRKPTALDTCGVLKSRLQWESALAEMESLHLPRHPDRPKNWDTLAAVAQVLAETVPHARILDAGAELYSSFLPSLYCYGYRELIGINLVFPRLIHRGPIRYEPGDITCTRFPDGHFDAVASLSVVEHGVDPRAFFNEMARILRPGGLLIISTDYWKTPVDTTGKLAFGQPIHVFTGAEMNAAVQVARECGLELTGPLDLDCAQRAVRWDDYGLQYTFIVLTLRRAAKVRESKAVPAQDHAELLNVANQS